MAKSVKNVIKGFNFETEQGKSAAKIAVECSNSETQVLSLCTSLNAANKVNVELAGQVVTVENKLKEVNSELKTIVSNNKRVINKKNSEIIELKSIVENKDTDLKNAESKHIKTIIDKDKDILRLDNTMEALRNSRTKLDKVIKDCEDNTLTYKAKVAKYEANWFVKLFLK